MSYEDQLQTEEWFKLRDKIKERDNNECQLCMRTEFLMVHHKQYLSGKLAWEYPENYLITLCGFCHAKFHDKDRAPVLERPYYRGEDMLQIAERTQRSVAALAKLDQRIYEKEVEEAKEFIKRAEGNG